MPSRAPLRFLVVMVHPHDFTHCAGTCGVHVHRGDTVTFVSLTGGARTHNEKLHDELIKPEGEQDEEILTQTSDEYVAQKGSEITMVCDLFGVTDVRALSFPDRALPEHPGSRRGAATDHPGYTPGCPHSPESAPYRALRDGLRRP